MRRYRSGRAAEGLPKDDEEKMQKCSTKTDAISPMSRNQAKMRQDTKSNMCEDNVKKLTDRRASADGGRLRTKSGRRRAVRRGGGGPAGGAEPQKAGLISHRRPWSQRHPQPRPQSHPLSPSTSAFLPPISSFPFPSPLSSRQNTAIRAVSRALKSSFPTRVLQSGKTHEPESFFS